MENDYQDIIELEALGQELSVKALELAGVIMQLVDAKCMVLQLTAKVEVMKDAKENLEELIRIKKLSINIKPR